MDAGNVSVYDGKMVAGTTRYWAKYAKEHGYGLSSIRDVVNLYSGTMDMVVEDGEFELIVSIPIE